MNLATLSVFQGYNSFYQAKQIKLRKIFSTNMLTLEKFASSTTMFNQCHGILKLMKVFTLPLKKQKKCFLVLEIFKTIPIPLPHLSPSFSLSLLSISPRICNRGHTISFPSHFFFFHLQIFSLANQSSLFSHLVKKMNKT